MDYTKHIDKKKLMDFIETQRIIMNKKVFIEVNELLEWIEEGELDCEESE